MKRLFKIELEVVVDDVNEEQVIQLARDQYQSDGCASEPICDGSEVLREIPPDEGIPDLMSAIMELIGSQSLLAKADIDVSDVACRELIPVDAIFPQ
jgi:hypothetical protein